MEIAIKDLKDLCIKALSKTGLSESHATTTVEHYLENECAGKKSHGMVRVIQVAGAVKDVGLPKHAPEIINDNGNMAIINGHKNLGPVIAKMVMEESITRAKKHGLALVGMKNYFGNTGSMAFYLKRLAENNLVGLMSCNSECMVAAPAGKERLLGTNPIGLCVPSADGKHFIADFATSAIAFGKILVAMDKGDDIPEGCIIDKDGTPSTNLKDAASDGAILPLADYRGFALGLFVEMMGMMMGAEVLHNETYGKDSLFIIAIDPTHAGASHYAEQVASILTQMRDSAPAPGHDGVSIPGDRSAAIFEQVMQRGIVDVADKTLEKIQKLAS